tara:strand:- start:14880 stop:15062 length:183 start_codon:yes stop_codon:yes gene_type:complete
MLAATTDVWSAFHAVSEKEQKDWLDSLLTSIKERDEQIEFYRHAWRSLATQTRDWHNLRQ